MFWPIPITLPVSKDLAARIHQRGEVALVDAETDDILAVMNVREKYSVDKRLEAEHVYRTPTRSTPASPRCWRRETSTWRGR